MLKTCLRVFLVFAVSTAGAEPVTNYILPCKSEWNDAPDFFKDDHFTIKIDFEKNTYEVVGHADGPITLINREYRHHELDEHGKEIKAFSIHRVGLTYSFSYLPKNFSSVVSNSGRCTLPEDVQKKLNPKPIEDNGKKK
jgi:hypothetical protein